MVDNVKTFIRRRASLVWEALKAPSSHSHQLISALFCTLLLFGLLYRMRLTHLLFTEVGIFPAFRPGQYSVLFLLKFAWLEFVFATLVAALAWFLFRSDRVRNPGRSWLSICGVALLHGFLIFVPLAYGVHQHTLFSVQAGLSYSIVLEASSAFAVGDILSFASSVDLILIFFPIMLFWAFLSFPVSWQFWRNRVALVTVGILVLLNVAQPTHRYPAIDKALVSNPILYFMRDLTLQFKNQRKPFSLRTANASAGLQLQATPLASPPGTPAPAQTPAAPVHSAKTPSAKADVKPSAKAAHAHAHKPALAAKTRTLAPRAPRVAVRMRMTPPPSSFGAPQTVRYQGPLFSLPNPTPKYRPRAGSTRWNVLFILLESTGMRYVLRKTPDGKQDIMPFFKQFRRKGWLFKRHFSTSNSSPRSIFSIFSGMYPLPRMRMFSTRRDAHIPSLKTFLGGRYESFLATPAPLRWYFPRAFLHNSGLREMYGYYSIPLTTYGPGRIVARHEAHVVDFFLKRLKSVKEPFFATYLSFIPHYPYTDYGKDHRLIQNTRRSIYRYYNNLHMLDKQIKRIIEYLRESGRLKRTIVVMVGDHGEAFGQHKGNYTHSQRSYNENFHTPLFIYQPRLFPPRTIYRTTSHVDILPTLLDALRIPYNPKLLQGESLYRSAFHRKQIFLYGNENTLSTITHDKIKLQISFRRRWCWVYNLKEDPSERKRLSCKGHDKIKQASLTFHHLQPQILQGFSKAHRQKGAFLGLKHPR